jgi:tripartite-type tricarboxylate transporter receptor subunit TctC
MKLVRRRFLHLAAGAGTQFTLVPYRGGAPALQDLVAGQIDLLFINLDALPLVRAGSIKAYAATSDTRSALAPDIPTFGEMGLSALSFSFSTWYALFAPKGTPKEIIDRLNAVTMQGLADPAARSRIVSLGMDIYPREHQTPAALGALQKAQIEKWWPMIKESDRDFRCGSILLKKSAAGGRRATIESLRAPP